MTNNCTQMRLLTTALLHDELDSSDREKTLAHLGECSECKEYYDKIKRLEDLLKSAIPKVEMPSVKNEVMRKISETEKNAAIRNKIMSIRFNCSNCKRHFEAEPKHIGKRMKCPKCGTVNQVPAASTIAPKQVRPPSNIAHADTGVMPAISKQFSAASSATPLAGELPTVKEIQKIASDIRTEQPRRKRKVRRNPSQDNRPPRPPRPDRQYREPGRPAGKSSQNLLVFGVVGVGLILVLIAAFFLFGNNGNNEEVTNPDKIVEEKQPEVEKKDDTTTVFKPTIVKEKTPDDTEKTEKKEEVEPEPIEPLEIVSTQLPRSEFYIYETNIVFGIQVKGGAEPYNFIISDGKLPEGLTFEKGVIKGDIRQVGEFRFTVQVKDSQNNVMEMPYAITVYDELSIDIQIPKKMEFQKEYLYELKVSGGKKPYSCSIIKEYLPQGVQFDVENFLIKGIPQETGGPFFIDLSFTDSIGQEDHWKHEWEIEEPVETKVEKPEDKKDDKELPNPDDKIDNPNPDNTDDSGLSQEEIIQLLNNYRRQALILTQQKKYQEAVDVYAKIIELDDMNANAYYNSACLYSIMDNKDKAIEFLEAAIRAGFRDLNHILNDPDFDNIKRDKRFKKLTKDQDIINQLSMDAIKAKVDKEFPTDEGFLKRIDHSNKLIFATNLGDNKEDCRAILDMLEERIENYAKAQWRRLFEEKPEYYITIALPKKPWFDRYKIKKRFPPMVGGWYNPADKFLIAGTMGHTLTHEFTHAMHYADMEGRKGKKTMHIWFTEGIATCFEDCKLPERSSQKPEPIPNGRVDYMIRLLKNAKVKKQRYWNWRKFFAQTRPEFMSRNRVGTSYAMSRCITLWLYRTKKLKKYYENYMDSCDNGTADGKNGITAMEITFKKKLEEIEQEWLEWMDELTFDPPKAYIGIRISNQPSKMGMGVVISEITEGGGAEDAELQKNDIIVTFNRMAIDQASHLMVAIAECKIGQRVECVIIRDGKPMLVKIKLKKKPKNFK